MRCLDRIDRIVHISIDLKQGHAVKEAVSDVHIRTGAGERLANTLQICVMD
jgi:hypothetical protein